MNFQDFRARYFRRFPPNSTKEEFVFKKVVGNGHFGQIFLATHIPDQREYAVKSFDKDGCARTGNVEKVYREKQILMSVVNPFVISCEYYFVGDDRIYFATPYMSGGDLYGYIMWSGQTPDETTAKFFSAQVLLALDYLHSLSILHRDLKPENLMLDDRGYLKVIDFGSSSVFKPLNYTMCGTIQFMAPEMLLGNGYGRSVDYWALGVLIYELCAFELPFDGNNHGDLAASIIQGSYPIKKGFSSALNDLISHLLDVNPVARFGCRQDGILPLKSHPWFASVDFDKLYNRKVVAPKLPKYFVPHEPIQQSNETGKAMHFEEFDHF